MKEILIIVGSLRKESFNLQLANILKEKLNKFNVEIITLHNIPMFNEDIEKQTPNEVSDLRNKVSKSDGIIFVSPEYNHSYSGVLKNTIDWLSRTDVLSSKKAAYCGVGYGNAGTMSAQNDLVRLLSLLNMTLMNKPRLAINGANLPIENNMKFIDSFVDSYKEFIKKH